MAIISTSRSLFERPAWKGVGHRFQERLVGGVASSQGEKTNDLLVEIGFCTDQAMQPMPIDAEQVTENAGASLVVGATKEDNRSSQRPLQIQTPPRRKTAPSWCCFDAGGAALAGSRHVFARPLGQTAYRRVLESRPYLGLPTAIVALDSCLKAGLVWRCKDRRYAETQTQPDYTSHRIGILPRALETVVVVELSIAGKSNGSPMFDQGVDHYFRTYGSNRPRRGQAAIQRNSRQNAHRWPTKDGQSFDRVEAVQLDLPGSDARQIPASWRRWPTNPPPTVEDTATPQNSTDRGNRGAGRYMPSFHFASNGDRAILSQGAAVLEPASDGKHLLLAGSIGAMRPARSRRKIAPSHPSQLSSLSTPKPSLHRTQGHPKANCYGTLRNSASNRSHDLASRFGGDVFQPFEATPRFLRWYPTNAANPQAHPHAWRRAGKGAELQSGYALLPFRPLPSPCFSPYLTLTY